MSNNLSQPPRLDYDADTAASAVAYLQTRARQLLHQGFRAEQIDVEEFGVRLLLSFCDFNQYQSFYLYRRYRGTGIAEREIRKGGRTVVTLPDCNIENFLKAKRIRHICVESPILRSTEYKAISDYYGDRRANRSQVLLMNHIDEGLGILDEIRAPEEAMRAYCLHPILQDDAALAHAPLDSLTHSPKVMALAMEYRSVANEYLSQRQIGGIAEIRLSPIACVNQMLIADKVQNYRDFLRHHSGHERAVELDAYFRNWMKRLGVDFDALEKVLFIPEAPRVR